MLRTFFFSVAVLLVSFSLHVLAQSASATEGQSQAIFLTIEHSVDGGSTFETRSSFNVPLTLGGNKVAVAKQTDKQMNGVSNVEAFRSLLAGKVGQGLYRIRTRSDPTNSSSPYIMASVPACELQKSGYKEDVLLHLDSKYHIVSLSYTSPALSISGRRCNPEAFKSAQPFATKIRIGEKTTAQSVPLQATGPKPQIYGNVNLGTEVDPQAAQKPKTFFGRWGMYIALIIGYILLRTSTLPAEDEKKPAQGTAAKK